MFNQKEYIRKYKQEHKERIKQLNKESYLRHKEGILARRRCSYSQNKKKMRVYFNNYNQLLKEEVLAHYSNNPTPKCLVCGEERLVCLSLDHLNIEEGTSDRKRGRQGHTLYSHLRKQGYPEGFQTLCMNCQFIKKHSKVKVGKVYSNVEGVE